jgi:hypothetical protein
VWLGSGGVLLCLICWKGTGGSGPDWSTIGPQLMGWLTWMGLPEARPTLVQ